MILWTWLKILRTWKSGCKEVNLPAHPVGTENSKPTHPGEEQQLHPEYGTQKGTVATTCKATGQAAVARAQPRALHCSFHVVCVTRTSWPQQQCCGIMLSRMSDWTALITVLRQFFCSFKVTETLLWWTIKLLPQSNSVLHLGPQQ